MSERGSINISLGGPAMMLTIILIILRITNVIQISWWWIFSPLWLPLAIAIGIVVILMLIIIIGKAVMGLIAK